MYYFERAKTKTDRRHGRWSDTDLSNVTLATILTNWAEVLFYLSYPYQNGKNTVGVLLSKVRGMWLSVDQTITFQQWLDSIGNIALPFEESLPGDSVSLVRYAKAWHSGYHVELVNSEHSKDANLSRAMLKDLLLTHPKHNLRNFTKKALVSVNGLFHPCDSNGDSVIVMGGGRNIYNSDDNQVGIYSFEAVGDIKTVIIDESWVSKIRPDASLYDGAYINLPENIDIENKTVLLVVGGYLNVMNDVYYEVAKGVFRVNFRKMLLLDRIFQSYEEMDLGALGLFPEKDSPTLTMLNTLERDEVILQYLINTRSFFVIVDTPSFFQEYRPVESLRLPGRSVDVGYDRLPLVGAYGRMMEYHVIKEHALKNDYHSKDQNYVYCASLNIRNYYDNNKRPLDHNQSINAGRNSYLPFKHDKYYYRLLGVEK